MSISIKEISKLTGYSQATVSNAISGKRAVSRQAAESIFEVAREHGYFQKQHITKIKFINFKDSGIVCADTPFFSEVIEGVAEEGKRLGLEIILCTLSKTRPDYAETLNEILSDTSCALIILGTEMTEDDAKLFEAFPNPLVMLDCWIDSMKFNTVLHSNTDSFVQATEYLIRCGHTDIGYLAGNIRIKNFRCRQSGYEIAMARHNLPIHPNYIFHLTPTLDDSFTDMNRLLDEGAKMPTALIADNDNIALGAIKALIRHDYKIPDDISIIGFDDIPFCTISSPALTTVKVHKRELGQAAVQRLVELINNNGDSQVKTKIEVCNELVLRESVRNLR